VHVGFVSGADKRRKLLSGTGTRPIALKEIAKIRIGLSAVAVRLQAEFYELHKGFWREARGVWVWLTFPGGLKY
jgi:hypothetical protein